MSTSLTPHDASVAAFYAKNVHECLTVKRRPYNNWGFWRDDPADAAAAGEALLMETIRAAEIQPEHEVLEVGCGLGVSTLDLAKKTGCKRAVGIDICEPFLAHARSQTREAGFEGIVSFFEMSATAIDFPDGSFDHVIAIDCAVHFEPRSRFFEEAYRVLRPGGRLTLADHVSGDAEPEDDIDQLFLDRAARMWHIPEVNRHKFDRYLELLRSAGFTAIRGGSIKEHVFPGAFRYYLSDAYLDLYREKMGEAAANVERTTGLALQRIYEKGYLDFVLVTADRGGVTNRAA